MLLVVSVVPFLVVVVVGFLWLGRLEVGYWSEALLAKVVFDCPPLYLVLQDSKNDQGHERLSGVVYLRHNCQLFPCLKGKIIRVLILDHIWTQFGFNIYPNYKILFRF